MFRYALAFAVSVTTGTAIGQSSNAPSATTRFDGTWAVTLVCDDYKDAGAGAKGYTFRFLAQVTGGHLEAQHLKPGTPGSLHYSGEIASDGTAEIQANGFTGNPDYSVNQVVRSTPYAYRLKAKFEGNRASATRLDLRPCAATFVKQ